MQHSNFVIVLPPFLYAWANLSNQVQKFMRREAVFQTSLSQTVGAWEVPTELPVLDKLGLNYCDF